jgi:hypothetical protein
MKKIIIKIFIWFFRVYLKEISEELNESPKKGQARHSRKSDGLEGLFFRVSRLESQLELILAEHQRALNGGCPQQSQLS